MFDEFSQAFQPEALGTLWVVVVKLGIGAVLGGAIGFEREVSGRPAGIRTHMLLVIGVVLFAEVSKVFGNGDPGRIAAQIVTGVGFLGAGTILRMGIEIKGLTSAASLWAVAAIGMAVSAGGAFLLVAVACTALTLITLAYVSKIEKRLVPYSHPMALQAELDSPDRLGAIVEAVSAVGGKVKGMRIVSSMPLNVQIDVTGEHDKCMSAVVQTPGVNSCGWMD